MTISQKELIGRLLFIAVMLVLFMTGCQRHEYEVLHSPYKVTDQLDNTREYRVFVPSYESDKKLPLLVYFHGVRSDCFQKKYPALKNYTGSPIEETGLIEFCKTNRIVLLVPEPKYEFIFLNCICKGWGPFKKEIDGIEKIIDSVVEKLPINKKRIFLAGLSAGAVLTFHLANRRPEFYNSILSHSQGSMYENVQYMMPSKKGPRFGVVLGYTKGDYTNLIQICIETEKIYKKYNYRVELMKNLPPDTHRWSITSNAVFWNNLNKLGQYPIDSQKN